MNILCTLFFLFFSCTAFGNASKGLAYSYFSQQNATKYTESSLHNSAIAGYYEFQISTKDETGVTFAPWAEISYGDRGDLSIYEFYLFHKLSETLSLKVGRMPLHFGEGHFFNHSQGDLKKSKTYDILKGTYQKGLFTSHLFFHYQKNENDLVSSAPTVNSLNSYNEFNFSSLLSLHFYLGILKNNYPEKPENLPKETIRDNYTLGLRPYGEYKHLSYSNELTINYYRPLIKSGLNQGIQNILRLSYHHADDIESSFYYFKFNQHHLDFHEKGHFLNPIFFDLFSRQNIHGFKLETKFSSIYLAYISLFRDQANALYHADGTPIQETRPPTKNSYLGDIYSLSFKKHFFSFHSYLFRPYGSLKEFENRNQYGYVAGATFEF